MRDRPQVGNVPIGLMPRETRQDDRTVVAQWSSRVTSRAWQAVMSGVVE